MSVRDSDAVRVRSSRLRTLASGVFVGAALAAMSFALREAGHRTAQQSVAVLPEDLSDQVAEAAKRVPPQIAPVEQWAEKPPAAALRAESTTEYASGKAGAIARVKKEGTADLKKALALFRSERRSLAAVPDSGLPVLKLGERGLTPRRDLVALDAARLPPGLPIVAKLGSRVLVPAEKIPEGLELAGSTIVEESGSQRLGILTGVILVQLKNWENRGGVAAAHGLVIQSEKPKIRYLFTTLQAPVGETAAAVAQALAGLQQDSNVERAEPEVLFRPAEAK